MGHLGRRFVIEPDAELAIESDPRTLSDGMIARIGALGFTRASFGVQEFDPDVQQAINRIQPLHMVTRATEALRGVGVGGINFDLIYGLPHQTSATLTRTVAQCCEIKPDRVALFGYAHVPWMAKNQRMIDSDALPDTQARADQAASAAGALTEAGYKAIGIDHFGRPQDALAKAAETGRLRRNFQGYTPDGAETLLGLGATSISRMPQGYAQNIAETGAWARAIEEKALPIAKGLALDDDDRLRAHVIERLMCDGTVDLVGAATRFDSPDDWYEAEKEALADLETDALITRDGPRLTLTETGKPLARIVASTFDSYLQRREARHSIAV